MDERLIGRRAALRGILAPLGAWALHPAFAMAALPSPLLSEAVPTDATIAFTGHSMLAAIFPNDNRAHNDGVDFPSLWQGETHFDFLGWSSNARRWRAKGYARTGRYDQLVMTDLGDLKTGLPHPASPEGRQNLQHLYWFAMTAIAQKARPVLYMPWSPVTADLDRDGLPVIHFERQWLEARTGQAVWVIPAGLFVRAVRDRHADEQLFVDPVHLRPNGPVPTGLAYLTYQFFTKTRVPDPTLFPEMEELAWRVLQDYRWAGFGGETAVPPLEIDDPLPDPAPLPPA
ncbi:hypothetical protein [Paracoccus salsus]|uniref:hypothetical protein n=1 Tax=Paracoccus salsus TaxID=2911061 RepID=UPI001F46443A|nr:hypothetical protein [Paracoccus salsus]MCF3972260.1 hypothetical protein [Paracoccus salsus]